MNKRDERKKQNRRLLTAFAASVLLHALVVAGSVYLQYMTGLKHPRLKTVDVTLVTLPGPGSPSDVEILAGPSTAPEVLPEPLPELEPVPEPQVPDKPTVPVEPEKREAAKKIPEKTLEKPKKRKKSPVEERLQELQQKVGQEQPSEFERTLARLQQKVQKGPPSDLYRRLGPGRVGRGEGAHGAPMSPYERYLARIATIIQQHWSFTPRLIRERGRIETYVALTIQPGGVVSDITFDRKSASEYFNDTVLKAIEKASPLPPVPEEVDGSALKIGLVFTPQGIE